ncbi:MAG: hypothetical protein AB8G96_15450 [Phycisphaerales bacterium]
MNSSDASPLMDVDVDDDVVADVDIGTSTDIDAESVRCIGCGYAVGGRGGRSCSECGTPAMPVEVFTDAMRLLNALVQILAVAALFGLIAGWASWTAIVWGSLMGLALLVAGRVAFILRGHPVIGRWTIADFGLPLCLPIAAMAVRWAVGGLAERDAAGAFVAVACLAACLWMAASVAMVLSRLARSRSFGTVASATRWGGRWGRLAVLLGSGATLAIMVRGAGARGGFGGSDAFFLGGGVIGVGALICFAAVLSATGQVGRWDE